MKQYFQKEISCNKQFSSTNFRSSKRVERKTFLDFFFKEKIQDLESRVFNIAAVCINQKYELVHTGVCQKKKKTWDIYFAKRYGKMPNESAHIERFTSSRENLGIN